MENFFLPPKTKNVVWLDKNISTKKFIKNIIYSPANIKIKFKIPPFVGENDDQKKGLKYPSPAGRGWGNNELGNKKDNNKKFVEFNTAPGVRLEPT